jgi:hypothetical protein
MAGIEFYTVGESVKLMTKYCLGSKRDLEKVIGEEMYLSEIKRRRVEKNRSHIQKVTGGALPFV